MKTFEEFLLNKLGEKRSFLPEFPLISWQEDFMINIKILATNFESYLKEFFVEHAIKEDLDVCSGGYHAYTAVKNDKRILIGATFTDNGFRVSVCYK